MLDQTFLKKWTMICLALVAAVGLAGCADQSEPGGKSGDQAGPASYPYKIVATTGMVADLVRAVAGEKAEVTQMMGASVDPHLYKPTNADMKMLSEADVIVYNGLHLEGKMGDTLVQLAGSVKVYAVTQLLPEELLIQEEGSATPDPHVWMDVAAWRKGVDVVKDALIEYDPTNKEYYELNAKIYHAKLAGLNAYVKKVMQSIPEEQRVLITAHDAFNYFGQAYDVEVRGVQGISTLSDPGMAAVNDLVQFVVDRKVGAIFVESSVSEQNIKMLQEGAKSKGHEVKIGGELFSDAMGDAGTYEGTYIGMIDHNATTIANALGGEAPDKGMQGKLSGHE